jgi:hypothetical protein
MQYNLIKRIFIVGTYIRKNNIKIVVGNLFWWGYLREDDHLGDPDLDGRIILK